MMIASLAVNGWELESARERNKQYPDSFHIPSEAELEELKPNDMVQLIFLFWEDDKPENKLVSCEKMWVSILNCYPIHFSGQLESMPGSSNVLKSLDVVDFSKEHVCSIYIRKTDPRHHDYKVSND